MNLAQQEMQDIIGYLQELRKDAGISQKFKEKADTILVILRQGKELAIEKALLELEELNALEASPYHRTQVWDLMGKLESLKKG